LSTIYNLLKLPFYSGIFEYPRGSGNWYEGKHQPLISRELFQKVQEKIAEENRPKTRFKELTFTKLMTCGYCGSGITAQEKVKYIISEGVSRTYIYYSCTRHKDHECKNPSINEDQLIEQLSVIIDQVDLDEIGAKEIIKREISKHNKLRANVLGIKEKDRMPDIDVRAYAKYLLREGTIYEKRELLEHLRNRIVLKDKKISLEN
jgi:predicted metal-binding protein